jgi:murein L,D-transpeptidase YcbB/YkuD
VRGELLPRFARDPAAAARQGFVALDASGAAVDPATVDWSARPFPYHLRQLPGPGNALGRIRFDLPNPYSIYLHDTPNRALFNRPDRALSHGCIRVDDPLGLASGVLDEAQWTPELLQAAIDTNEQRIVPVTHATAVYILYLTAAVGDGGDIAYYDDLYGRDRRLIAALDAPDVALVADIGATPRCPA